MREFHKYVDLKVHVYEYMCTSRACANWPTSLAFWAHLKALVITGLELSSTAPACSSACARVCKRVGISRPSLFACMSAMPCWCVRCGK